MYYADFVKLGITPEQGAWRGLEIGPLVTENAEKILNRGNEPKDLLKAKKLAFSGAENELVFQSQEPQTKRKMVAKRHDSYTGKWKPATQI